MEENLLGHHVEQEDAYIPWNIPAIHSKLFCDAFDLEKDPDRVPRIAVDPQKYCKDPA